MEVIGMYKRVREMFNIFIAQSRTRNDYTDGFGNWWEKSNDNIYVDTRDLVGIIAYVSQTVFCSNR